MEASVGNSSSGAVGIKIREATRRDKEIGGVSIHGCEVFSGLTLRPFPQELSGSVYAAALLTAHQEFPLVL